MTSSFYEEASITKQTYFINVFISGYLLDRWSEASGSDTDTVRLLQRSSCHARGIKTTYLSHISVGDRIALRLVFRVPRLINVYLSFLTYAKATLRCWCMKSLWYNTACSRIRESTWLSSQEHVCYRLLCSRSQSTLLNLSIQLNMFLLLSITFLFG